MFDNVITTIDQVTTDWLTAVLSQSSALTQGAVASIECDAGAGNWSANSKLKLTYTAEAKGTLPQRLFLKLANTDLGNGESFDDSEVAYYTRDYVDTPNAPLIHCYNAAYSAKLKRYHVLLDDVSETHIVAGEKKPTLEYGLALAEGLAVMHARWWGVQGLAEAKLKIHSAEHIQTFVDISRPGVAHIVNRTPNDLKPHWPEAMNTLFAKHPRALKARAQNVNGFTLIHGDAGEYNILVPRDGVRPIYLIDRQPFNWSLTVWLGVYDLAYALVLDWDVDLRRQDEIPVLEQYHAHLIQNGVAGYTWEHLYDDYRLCVVMCVYIATEYCRGGVNKRWLPVWLRMLQRALTACDDLNCYELWTL
ncbi:MAG: hypothetical protein IPM53_13295 [Anaerolineaceae bacterium]|nr:hypothetical protein [Anaerolineaceae bacterium]